MWCLHVKKIFVALCLWISTAGLFAQIGSIDLPVEPTDVYDWRAVRINPAISGLQSGAVEAGYRVVHAGFADAGTSLFKSAYLILNVPRRLPWALSAGLTTSMFATPLLQENQIHLYASKRISPSLSLGLAMGSLNINYQVNNFFMARAMLLMTRYLTGVAACGNSTWVLD